MFIQCILPIFEQCDEVHDVVPKPFWFFGKKWQINGQTYKGTGQVLTPSKPCTNDFSTKYPQKLWFHSQIHFASKKIWGIIEKICTYFVHILRTIFYDSKECFLSFYYNNEHHYVIYKDNKARKSLWMKKILKIPMRNKLMNARVGPSRSALCWDRS